MTELTEGITVGRKCNRCFVVVPDVNATPHVAVKGWSPWRRGFKAPMDDVKDSSMSRYVATKEDKR